MPAKALLLVGHGSSLPDNRKTVETHAERIREMSLFEEVDTCFVQGTPPLEGALERLDSEEIVVVPVFISSGVHTQEDIPRGLSIESTDKDVKYGDPLGRDGGVTEVILRRAGVEV